MTTGIKRNSKSILKIMHCNYRKLKVNPKSKHALSQSQFSRTAIQSCSGFARVYFEKQTGSYMVKIKSCENFHQKPQGLSKEILALIRKKLQEGHSVKLARKAIAQAEKDFIPKSVVNNLKEREKIGIEYKKDPNDLISTLKMLKNIKTIYHNLENISEIKESLIILKAHQISAENNIQNILIDSTHKITKYLSNFFKTCIIYLAKYFKITLM